MTPRRAYQVAMGDDPARGDPQRAFDVPGVSEQARGLLAQTKLILDSLYVDLVRDESLLSPDFKRGWLQFWAEVWVPFYQAHSAMGVSDLTEATFQQLVQINGQALSFRAQYQALGGHPSVPMPILPPPEQPKPFLSIMSVFSWGLLVVGGLFAVGYAASSLGVGQRSHRAAAEGND